MIFDVLATPDLSSFPACQSGHCLEGEPCLTLGDHQSLLTNAKRPAVRYIKNDNLSLFPDMPWHIWNITLPAIATENRFRLLKCVLPTQGWDFC